MSTVRPRKKVEPVNSNDRALHDMPTFGGVRIAIDESATPLDLCEGAYLMIDVAQGLLANVQQNTCQDVPYQAFAADILISLAKAAVIEVAHRADPNWSVA